MSVAGPSRLLLRQTRLLARQTTRRYASTTEVAKDTATKSKETASNVTSKASEGLTRVTSSASPAISGTAQGIGKAVSRISGRAGRLISFIESLIPPAIYYSRVGFEISKIVFRGQKMSPPSLDAFQKYLQPAINILRHPANIFNRTVDRSSNLSPESVLNRVRNLNTQQMVALGVVGAEALGFFTVGEMIGRLKLVGYHSDKEHHETATTTH